MGSQPHGVYAQICLRATNLSEAERPRLVSGYVCCLKSLLAHLTLNICYVKKTILQLSAQ